DLIPIPDFTPMIKDRIKNMRANISLNANSGQGFFLELPEMEIEVSNVGFDLDQLPGIDHLDTKISLSPVENGLHVIMDSLNAKFPLGNAKGSVDVVITDRAKVLDVNTSIVSESLPLEYILDLIYALNDLELIPSKELTYEEAVLITGNLNFDGQLQTLPFALSNMNFKNSNLKLKNVNNELYELKNVSLAIDKLELLRDSLNNNKVLGVDEVKLVSKIEAIKMPNIGNIPLYFKVEGNKDLFTSYFTTTSDIEKTDMGKFVLNNTSSPTTFSLDYQLSNISLKRALEQYSDEELMEGTLDININFNGYLNKPQDVMKHLEGRVSIVSDSLILHGFDLDDLLKKYKRSQNFNLVDLSAFLLTGPMGAVVTKGRDFASLIKASKKPGIQTVVPSARANWSYSDGLLSTEDVAFSTLKNRIAFDGVIDVAHDSIPDFSVYVVDKEGCSLMEQSVSGSMDSLKLGKLNISKTLLGSVINFVDAVVGNNCEVVYDGDVSHPK
ncbi:MAG: AsmA family protein, partial [Eudoraea sp.]|uniref:AsmA family protein n=1 Tax=Eudoraea sp. TaxID=1979955 RepID=UPI003C78E2AA